ncbi:MAG TPA: flagellar basal body P-ring formation chaperone FlgA [Steroidobacteraceae bacterium]|jgi:flagella basal body P-ring formation protein FlgA|nr:flagellar basal body P-ring formation chaperone FlgA [Steroidobacteraceae bacterium]
MAVKALSVFCVLVVAGVAPAQGQVRSAAVAETPPGLQSLAAVRSAAERALRRQIDPQLGGVTLNAVALDTRLRLAACPNALDTLAQPPRGNQARALVRVSCSGAVTWTLNVPVEIRRELDVLVLKRAVARGEILGAADVVAQKRQVASLTSPYVGRVADLAGRPTRRPLPEGMPVTAEALSAALLIKRGQAVTLTASTAGFEVRAPGRALADASASQRLRVQNLDSLKVVEGIAESEGVVRVSP